MLWYSLEATRRGASNEYHNIYFLWKNTNDIITFRLENASIWSYDATYVYINAYKYFFFCEIDLIMIPILRRIMILSGDIIQSTLVISKPKGLSEILRDIRTSAYQVCKIEEKNKSYNYISQMIIHIIKHLKLNMLKILWKRGEIATNFSSFPQYFSAVVRFPC